MKTLVTGWFSFEQMGATAGDLLARDLVGNWLFDAGEPFDVAVAPPFTGGVDWRAVEPAAYSRIIFVCGPFGNGPPVTELMERYAHCRWVGVNLSMLQPVEEWDPFDVLLARDSSHSANPDISFLSNTPPVPVIGVVLVEPQHEYKDRALHEAANEAIARLLGRREAAVVHIDTRLDVNGTGLRSPAEIESLIARMDAVVTTRLHGTVLALKNGVPALPIDPIKGGAKISRQVGVVGWPLRFCADGLDDQDLDRALDWCLSPEARETARECAKTARSLLEVPVSTLRSEFLGAR